MASPHADSFYCLLPTEFNDTELDIYNAICMVSSVFGLLGALHQIRTWNQRLMAMRETEVHNEANRRLSAANHQPVNRQNGSYEGFVNPHVVLGLAKADFAACIVLIVRSIMSLLTNRPRVLQDSHPINTTTAPVTLPTTDSLALSRGVSQDDDLVTDRYTPYHWWYVVIGGPVELLLLYFYATTFFWTFTYALSVNLKLHNKRVSNTVLSCFCWLTPLIPTAIYAFAKFYPSGVACAHHDSNLYTAYMCLYVPLVIVMVMNPVIYINSYKKVETVMQRRSGRLTNHERQVLLAIKYKFFLIMLFFYICWTMNIVDGVYEVSSDRETPYAMLVVEACFNPLQGLFNALVYGRHNYLKYFLLRLTRKKFSQTVNLDRTFGKETDRLVTSSAAP